MPPSHITVTRTIPSTAAQLYSLLAGIASRASLVHAAGRELEGFVAKPLPAEDMTVKRPSILLSELARRSGTRKVLRGVPPRWIPYRR